MCVCFSVCSESDSRSSDDSVDLKKANRTPPDIKVEYSKTNAVDDWQTDLLVPPRYSSPHPPQSDYSELHNPRKVHQSFCGIKFLMRECNIHGRACL